MKSTQGPPRPPGRFLLRLAPSPQEPGVVAEAWRPDALGWTAAAFGANADEAMCRLRLWLRTHHAPFELQADRYRGA